jgi:hypothetical protein
MTNIPVLLGELAKMLGELERTLRESPVSENPEVQAAKEKLLNTIMIEMGATSEQSMTSSIALPFLEKLQESLPLSIPFNYMVAEEDEEKEPS